MLLHVCIDDSKTWWNDATPYLFTVAVLDTKPNKTEATTLSHSDSLMTHHHTDFRLTAEILYLILISFTISHSQLTTKYCNIYKI